MFGDFLRRLTDPQPETLGDHDARLALGALMVRIARADNVYTTGEKRRIDRIIAARYGLDDAAAGELRAEAEVLESEAPDTVRFTSAIKAAVPYEDRLGVVEALWQVVLADGSRAQEEDAVLRMASHFLGISDRDSALIRQRVENQR